MLGTAPFRPHRYRQRRSSAPAWGRFRRALRRQWAASLVTACAIAALGLIYFAATGPVSLQLAVSWLSASLAAGGGVGVFLELGRNTVTSLASLGKHRGYAVLGAAPELPPQALRELPPDQRTPLGCIALQLSSPFATAFRNLQGALNSDQVVSFIAARSNEGASTAALCTAVSAIQQGRRVILLDCDLRRRTFTSALEHEPAAGLVEACANPEDWRDFVDEEEETGLHFIPMARTHAALGAFPGGTAGMAALIQRLSDAYDLIVLDCPPTKSSPDGAVLAALADKCVVVAAWDETPLSALRVAMRALKAHGRAALGVYVNRVPPGYRFGRLRPG